jgi:formylglycine-generating enzyme required for sulfatase activity/predicted Ser/Thr protein kinase
VAKLGPKADESDAATPAGIGQAAPALATFDLTGAGADDDEVLERGTSLGRYLVLERLGAGAMGVVYAAYDQELDRKIAIKILRSQDGQGDKATHRHERLVREAKAIAKLSHPNVVGIFDVGEHEGRVFLAMEYLGGGTLRDWLAAKKRSWRETVKMFVEVGQGLAAAHAEGLIHRDFKPDNVLLDKQGKPKVVDFGLVRLRSAALEPSAGGITEVDATGELLPALSIAETALGDLTRTGALTGTPAYMAPEQFLGKPIDARTDQFAFCVALYEAFYGERPFAGKTVMALAGAVTAGRLVETPNDSDVPGWIRRTVLLGLATNPAQRYPSMAALLHALAADPVARRRRRAGIAAALIAVAVVGIGLQRRSEHRRMEFEHRIAVQLAEGGKSYSEAQALGERVQSLRTKAFALFDAHERERGERVWTEARTASVATDAALSRAQRSLEVALAMDQSRAESRRRLAEVAYERAALAEQEVRSEDLARHLGLLETVDTSGDQRKRWRKPGSLSLRTIPSEAKISIERYEPGLGPLLTLVPVSQMLSSPLIAHALPPGSYRVRIDAPGYLETAYPVVIRRGESSSGEITLPRPADVPDDYAYVPGGRFQYGDHDDELRLTFLNAVPIHEREARSFLIKKHEITFGEWIAYLSSLSRSERAARLPASKTGQGSVALEEPRAGEWKLRLSVSNRLIEASSGEKLIYPGRSKSTAAQDWLRIPVVGISARDMRAYVAWLSATGKVPGARLCTDTEWERAARGADHRVHPSALVRLDPKDANFDATYGRISGAYGPDEVGRHPEGRSPFGVDDMAGNVWEVAVNDDAPDSFVVRGGCYYEALRSSRSTNREPIEVESRHHTMGFRTCADWPREPMGRDQ